VPDPTAVFTDLAAESAELDALVAGLAPGEWARPTPAPGWTIAHQIAHLAWTDQAALTAATDPERFAEQARAALAENADGFVDEGARAGAALPPAEILAGWRAGREALDKALRATPREVRMPWYRTRMSAVSMATGRLMETWAHGLDVADALGVTREPTGRLRHVVHIGVRARDYAFAAHGLTPPAEEFRVELTAPGGEVWASGPQEAAQRVTGPALDFCLLVVQRRHRDDLALRAEGADADRWLGIAQAFAGPPGAGRAPGQHGQPGRQGRPG
jgi:uncharacterized protein (TIGR03084 family)